MARSVYDQRRNRSGRNSQDGCRIRFLGLQVKRFFWRLGNRIQRLDFSRKLFTDRGSYGWRSMRKILSGECIMKIEIKVHQGYGKLKHVETIEVDCLFNLSTILESYPAHEVH